ncbi:Glycosyl transferase, family 1 [Kalmanozyma brasiliensis GHG001]|uniref:Glycosyltransferase n=1 Tax=Kalmanozyma brasiliensis (strain GHG001) TaxID=1365824 RepID=V5EW69_KALBG|nr:Glycosyl transferase, family 1 [Kalmanozyma brasiliensis GHG001]EST09795.1 Glycosyl transferase, family 1 [Kalmanozyma brasiliensis GHG001]
MSQPQVTPMATVNDLVSAYPRDLKRPKLRVAIITENFLPKVDGVTRTLARLLEHLNAEGHEAMVLGPETGIRHYAGHPVVGTFGIPLIIYPGLKLNFMRPRFVRRLQQFKPDIIHFVDPIWLGAQMLPTVQKYLPEVPCVSSYHTNLPTYATLFGMPWLERTMWNLTRNLHDRCEMVFCPSETTRRMLRGKGFTNVEIWSRGVDTELFNPQARDENLRESWGCTPKPASLRLPLSPSVAAADATTMFGSEHAALSHLAGKLGVKIVRKEGDESFIRTPPTNPVSPECAFTPPPAYDDLTGLPDLPSGFLLPPPALPASTLTAIPPTLRVSPEPASSKTVVLYVGRISWEKNLRLLIEAFHLLPTSVRSKAKLVFVGDGPARGDLTRLCNKLELDASFMGHQKGSRLAAMYASASIFAFPSFTETFGQVVLEALASGLPVVGMHAEGTSDLVVHGRTGLLLDVNAVAKSATVGGSRPATPGAPKNRGAIATEFANAASSAAFNLPPSPSSPSKPAQTQDQVGLPTPIPTTLDFKASMTPNTPWFQQCAKSYSMLLERLILDRQTRALMGQRAVLTASRKTWWDAMDAPVRGYESVIAQCGTTNLNDDELEAWRNRQRRNAPLTGPRVKTAIALLVLLFAWLLSLLFHSK